MMSPFQDLEDSHVTDTWPSKFGTMRAFRNVEQVLLDLAVEAEKAARNTHHLDIALERLKAAQGFRDLAAKLPGRLGEPPTSP